MSHALHEFRPTWAAWFRMMLCTGGFAIPYVWWRRRGVRYEVTDDRIVKHTGRLSSRTDEFLISEIKRIKTSQSFGEKLLGGGTITVDSGMDSLTLAAVPDHQSVAETIRANQPA
jgi:uncharacterized membrane protein YdbT with pleckstrin-like domain